MFLMFLAVRLSSKDLKVNMGGMEVYHKNEWKTVCDATISNTEATVACRSLKRGFKHGVVIKVCSHVFVFGKK